MIQASAKSPLDVTTSYLCNVCQTALPPSVLVGIRWTEKGIVRADPFRAADHICPRCLTQLSAMGRATVGPFQQTPSLGGPGRHPAP